MILRCTTDPNAGTRPIVQFHYTSWPLSAQPDNGHLLLFHRHIASHLQSETCKDRPALVHCHDGGGRSGNIMAYPSAGPKWFWTEPKIFWTSP